MSNPQGPFYYNDYLLFFNKFTAANPTEYEILDVNCLKMNVIEHKCQQYNVTVNSILLSVFSAATGVREITMTVDVRKKLPTFKEGTIGNYSTAMKITSSSKKLYECYERARDIQEKVVEKLNNNYNLFIPLSCLLLMDGSLIDSMVMSGSGHFKSFAGRSAMKIFGNSTQEKFAITNLGKFDIEGTEDVVFIPPASPINRQTVGVITVNGKMSICDSYYSNLVSKDEVKDILSKVYKSL